MARGKIHYIVKEALEKEAWKITHDPYSMKIGGFEMEIDLAAEEMLGAERENQKIAVEIKTFGGLSKVHEFHVAIGQYVDYRVALKTKEPERILFLALVQQIYEDIFQRPFAQMVISELNIKIVVIDPLNIEIIQWIN